MQVYQQRGTRRQVRRFGLLIGVIGAVTLAGQTATWIAPGPYGAGTTYDAVHGYWLYDFPPAARWQDAANWDTGQVPNGSNAVATMSGYSNGLSGIVPPVTNYPGARAGIIDSGAVTLAELHFQTGSGPTQNAPRLTIGTDSSAASLTLTGAGLTWTDGLPGNYFGPPSITLRNGWLEFDHQAGAVGSITSYWPDGHIIFRDQATAGTATISSGSLDFYDQSTAGQASLTVYGGLTFHDHATFGNATFSSYWGPLATFRDFSSAGAMNASHVFNAPPWPDTRIFFQDHATAANAVIDVTEVSFSGQSTAASAQLKVTGGDVIESHGYMATYTSSLRFSDQSTAAQATITNEAHGTVVFQDDSSAGTATIVNNGTLVFSGRAALADAQLTAGSGRMVVANVGQVDPYGELYFVPQYATTGRITFKDQASGGAGGISITRTAVVLDLSGLQSAPTGTAGRALLPATPAGNAITPDDAGALALGSISDPTAGATIYLGATRLQLGGANRDMVLNSHITDLGGAYGSLAGEPLQGGGLDKVGTGTLTIGNAANSFRGSTEVRQGRLNLANGRVSATTVASGAVLTGTGVITGNLLNSGVVSPGNSPGTIAVEGNYTQAAPGTLAVALFSAAGADRLAVDGTATLDGTLTVSAPADFAPVGDTREEFLAAQAVSGRFSLVTLAPGLAQKIGAALTSHLVYSATGVSFQITQQSFAGFAPQSPAAAALGTHLDATLAHAAGEYRNRIASLNTLATPAQVGAALAALAPDRYTVLGEDSLASAALLQVDLDRRLAAGRGEPGRGLDLFFSAGSRTAVYSATGDAPAARSRLGRGTAGGIWNTENFALGASLGYESGEPQLDAMGSSASLKSVVPAVFAQYASDRLFLNVSAARAANHYSLRRRVVYAGNDQAATARTSGSREDCAITAGYVGCAGGWSITPQAGLLSSRFQVDDFSESGAPGADLALSRWSERSLRSRVGLEATRPDGRYAPRLSVLWLHELAVQRSFEARFTEDPGTPYAVPGRLRGKDCIQASLSLDARLGQALTGYASVGGVWGRHTRVTPDISAGLSWHF